MVGRRLRVAQILLNAVVVGLPQVELLNQRYNILVKLVILPVVLGAQFQLGHELPTALLHVPHDFGEDSVGTVGRVHKI